jgi:hypothetical protein
MQRQPGSVGRQQMTLPSASLPTFEIVLFRKEGGPLTKTIKLNGTGVVSDGSACYMARGTAQRTFVDIQQFADLIGLMETDQAISLGMLRSDCPDVVSVVTQRRMNGGAAPDVITRTQKFIGYRPGQPGLALIDFDTKGMPDGVRERLAEVGGIGKALVSVLPELERTAMVVRASTSSGLYRKDTSEWVSGSSGWHVYLFVRDAADSERFLKALHERCWLAGFGWMIVGRAGQFLDRSIVDRMVGAPERLVFEGAPVLEPPLMQDMEKRRPMVRNGGEGLLDTATACPPLGVKEFDQLKRLQAAEKQRLGGDAGRTREAFVVEQSNKIAKRSSVSQVRAREIVTKWCDGILLPNVELAFDDPELAGTTVADVLADPDRFEGETLADPIEGVAYGRGKAKVMRRADGMLWIKSFAHGGTHYDLRHDAAAIAAEISKVGSNDAVAVLTELAVQADVDATEVDVLVRDVSKKTGVGVYAIKSRLKEVKRDKSTKDRKEKFERIIADRTDPRPTISLPPPDAPWFDVMRPINDVLGRSKSRLPPARNLEGLMACIRQKFLSGIHTLGAGLTSEAPPQWVIHTMDDAETAELIEQYIDYYVESESSGSRSVHLQDHFVKQYHQRRFDNELPDMVALPVMTTIVTLPIVTPDGQLVCGDGLDRKTGVVYHIDPELLKNLPTAEECDDHTVAGAMQFLLDKWLVDVSADLPNKCHAIVAALTLIERVLLNERPVFMISAEVPEVGKTTLLHMIFMAIHAIRAAASAWSPNEEERRKSIHSHALEGVPSVVWDNNKAGSRISCPHIERSCTSILQKDRTLGVSETPETEAAIIYFFTGNSIVPENELVSRTLQVSLTTTQLNPADRKYQHQDPIDWTMKHRAEILRALYIILMGNPVLKEPLDKPMPTRFKLWMRMVCKAVEHGARCWALYQKDGPDKDAAKNLNYGKIFRKQKSNDPLAFARGEMLEALKLHMDFVMRAKFRAKDIAGWLNDTAAITDKDAEAVRRFLFPKWQRGVTLVSSQNVTDVLRAHVGPPGNTDEARLVLRVKLDRKGVLEYNIEVYPLAAEDFE